jgi:hypothetical protein
VGSLRGHASRIAWSTALFVCENDEGDNVVREIVVQPVTLYSTAQLEQWAHDFPENLAAEQARAEQEREISPAICRPR